MMPLVGTTPFLRSYSDRAAAIYALQQSPSLQGLTTRLVEVAWMVGDGIEDKPIAAQLGVSRDTVRKYRARIGQRLGLDPCKRNEVQIARRVIEAWEWIETTRAA